MKTAASAVPTCNSLVHAKGMFDGLKNHKIHVQMVRLSGRKQLHLIQLWLLHVFLPTTIYKRSNVQ